MKLFALGTFIAGALATSSASYGSNGNAYSNGGMPNGQYDSSKAYSYGSPPADKNGKNGKYGMTGGVMDGEKATKDIMVISQNWGDGKGEMQMNAASNGGKVHTVGGVG
jgi:hypothetical protein